MMQILNALRSISPLQREEFERAERKRERDVLRTIDRTAGAKDAIAKAEAKRARRRQRNLERA